MGRSLSLLAWWSSKVGASGSGERGRDGDNAYGALAISGSQARGSYAGAHGRSESRSLSSLVFRGPLQRAEPVPRAGVSGPTPERSARAEDRRAQEPPARSTGRKEELERVSREIQTDLEELRGEKFLRPVAVRVASKKS
jgi:hypothetical protein